MRSVWGVLLLKNLPDRGPHPKKLCEFKIANVKAEVAKSKKEHNNIEAES